MIEESRRWNTIASDETVATQLSKELELPLPLARILAARGFADASEAERYLNPRLSSLTDPFEMPGMDAAVARIWKAIDEGESITVFGDYDCDGVTSTALVVSVLERLGASVAPFIPKRSDEGYGFSIAAFERSRKEAPASLIITVDCGSGSIETVAAAKAAGIDVVITDHHELVAERPAAVALINPRLGVPEELESLSGAGVAFKLCHGVVSLGLRDGRELARELDLRADLDIVAIGTVADVVPLTGENRILVRHGLRQLNEEPRCGVTALLRVANVRMRVDCYHLGFLIGPRINAAGRLGDARPALDLLLTRDPGMARRLAGQLDAANRERKRIEETILQEADVVLSRTYSDETHTGIVVGARGWHIGAIGIAAARLSGRYRRPTVVIAVNAEGVGTGSCRSVEPVNVIEVLEGCADLLERFGGHRMAAGLTIKEDKIAEFTERFNAMCAKQATQDDYLAVNDIDAWITLGEADTELLAGIDRLRPLGQGNPTPYFATRGVSVIGRPKLVGKNHLKMVIGSGASEIDAIAFGMADRAGELKRGEQQIDLIYQVQENNYFGRKAVQLNITDFRMAEAGDTPVG